MARRRKRAWTDWTDLTLKHRQNVTWHRVQNVSAVRIHSNPPGLPFQLLTDTHAGRPSSCSPSGRRWHSTGRRPSSRDAQQLSCSTWQKLRQGRCRCAPAVAVGGHLGASRRQRNHSALWWHPSLVSHAHSCRATPTSSTDVWLKKLGSVKDFGRLPEQIDQSEGTGRQGGSEPLMRLSGGVDGRSKIPSTVSLILETSPTISVTFRGDAFTPDSTSDSDTFTIPTPEPSSTLPRPNRFGLPVVLGLALSTFSVRPPLVVLAVGVASHAWTNLRIPVATLRISSPTPDRSSLSSGSSFFFVVLAVSGAPVVHVGVVAPVGMEASDVPPSVGVSVVDSSFVDQNQASEFPAQRARRSNHVWIFSMLPAPATVLQKCLSLQASSTQRSHCSSTC